MDDKRINGKNGLYQFLYASHERCVDCMKKSLNKGIDPRMTSDNAKFDAMAWLAWGFQDNEQAMHECEAYKLLDQALSRSKGK